MFAVAQKKYTYIYDSTGMELHCLRKHTEVNKLEFLPYHFLLVTIGNAGWLKYQDTSTGNRVAEFNTKLGRCDCMVQNPYNGIINLGHSNGNYTLIYIIIIFKKKKLLNVILLLLLLLLLFV